MNQSEFSTKSREDYASREIQTFGWGMRSVTQNHTEHVTQAGLKGRELRNNNKKTGIYILYKNISFVIYCAKCVLRLTVNVRLR